MTRAQQLGDQLRHQAEALDRESKISVGKDSERMLDFLQRLDRGPNRGVAMFSCSSEGLWEQVVVPRPLKERAALAKHLVDQGRFPVIDVRDDSDVTDLHSLVV